MYYCDSLTLDGATKMDVGQALKAENDSLKDVIKNVNAEKTAIDQMYVNSIRDNLALRSQLILLNNQIDELKSKLAAFENVSKPVLAAVLDGVEADDTAVCDAANA